MRKIDKSNPINSFTEFVKIYNPTEWRDFKKYSQENVRRETRESILLDEQYLLCGYTEIFIDDLDESHIDHYIKRSIDNSKTFKWENLIVSVNDEDFGAKYKDSSGLLKSLQDYTGIFNPVSDVTQNYFKYMANGKILPADNLNELNRNKAEKTINIFNLNNNSLCERRKDVFININSYKEGGLNDQAILNHMEINGFKSFIEFTLTNYF